MRPAVHIAGKVQALDRKTPLGNVVVELVQPELEDAGSGQSSVRTFNSAVRTPQSELGAPPASTNRVLNLPRDGSYAVLPPDLLSGLTKMTIEGWTKWTGGQPPPKDYEPVFGFGHPSKGLWLGSKNRSTLEAGFDLSDGLHTVTVDQAIRTEEWIHWALVTRPGEMKLFLNGILAARKTESTSVGNMDGGQSILGRNYYRESNPTGFTDLTAQLDDIRIWNVERTDQQIRDNMLVKLSGHEPGLVALGTLKIPASRCEIDLPTRTTADSSAKLPRPTVAQQD